VTDTNDITVAIARFASLLLESARADSGANIKLAQVVQFYPPGALLGSDGKGVYAWPASVDVITVSLYTRVVQNVAHKGATEIPVGLHPGGTKVAGPEVAQRVPVLFIGGLNMALTEPPLVGSYGLLLLTGKSHGTTIADGIPVPAALSISTERISDAFFLPGFLPGLACAALPPSTQPTPASMAQLGPRTAEAETTYLRKTPQGWALGAPQVQLGSVAAILGVARQTDTVGYSPEFAAFVTNVIAALGLLGVVVAPPVGANVGLITGGSTVVKST
jgi:hypothetical protein